MLSQDVVCSKFLPNANKYNELKNSIMPIDEAANEETISIVRTCCKEMKECCTMCWCEMMCCGCFRKMCSKTESEKMSAGIVDTNDDEHEDTVESSKEPTVESSKEPTVKERLQNIEELKVQITAEMDKIQEQISESGMNGAETTKAAGTNIVPHDESVTGVELVYEKEAGATET